MNRQHVHLSRETTTASAVGSRHGPAVVLSVDAVRMHADGFQFFCSENNVWLTDHVPHDYISGLPVDTVVLAASAADGERAVGQKQKNVSLLQDGSAECSFSEKEAKLSAQVRACCVGALACDYVFVSACKRTRARASRALQQFMLMQETTATN